MDGLATIDFTGNRFEFGAGNDTLRIEVISTVGGRVTIAGNTLIGGGGTNTLILTGGYISHEGGPYLAGISFDVNTQLSFSGFDHLIGSLGADVIRMGASNDTIEGLEGDDTLGGGLGDDLLNGGTGFDVADYTAAFGAVAVDLDTGRSTGADGNDTLVSIEGVIGSAFADRFVSGAGSNLLNGGDGTDAAIYSGARRQYEVDRASVAGGPEGGTDTLISMEILSFVDGALTFDASSASAQVMRLYSAALNRTPDQGGLEFNVAQLASIGLRQLAETFVASDEFQARFGALNNQQFVEQLYVFALGRSGDPGGIAFFVSQLDGGATRGEIVVGFSESAENQTRTAATLDAGLWVPDQNALIIARLYDATFDRLPDAGGLASWVDALNSGTSLQDIASFFSASGEFQGRYGTLSNQAFVEQLYRFCLDREGDAEGIGFWTSAIDGGLDRASVLAQFSESAEHAALTAPLWSGGIRLEGTQGNSLFQSEESGTDSGLQGLVSSEDEAPKAADLIDAGALQSGATSQIQIYPEVGIYDPADIGIDFQLLDDAFMPSQLDEPVPSILLGIEAVQLVALPLRDLPGLADIRMVLHPISEDGTLDTGVPWFRTHDQDGWIMQ